MDLEASQRIEAIKEAFPREGLFADKSWLISPEPFPLPKKLVREIERLGKTLRTFVRACNTFYFRSLNGTLPPWIAQYLDAGKPDWILEMQRHTAIRDALPQVLRPDLILTDDGFIMTELDNVPGGIGVTAWLNETYSRWYPGVIGGKAGMIAGFRRILLKGGDILISDESADYRPEMSWLTRRLNEQFFHEGTIWRALKAADYPAAHYREIYRFYELFDVPDILGAQYLGQQAIDGIARITPPYKAFLEEKLWLALFHMHPLRQAWIRELRASNWRFLQNIIPYSWVLDPTPLPHHAVLPRLEINDWSELRTMSQSERALVCKISGFSELAWGSRGVSIGQDLSQEDWAAAIDHALASIGHAPYILQEFHKGTRIAHPYWDESEGRIRTLEGRVRLCPYFLPDENGEPALEGILATIVPSDKKLIHGMKDAILVPCTVVD